jgi:hypothetical protein
MQMLQCANCARLNGFKRNFGFGTFVMVLLTAGLWILAMPLYPKRCIGCGFSADDLPSNKWGNSAVAVAILVVVGLIVWEGSRRDAAAEHGATLQPVDTPAADQPVSMAAGSTVPSEGEPEPVRVVAAGKMFAEYQESKLGADLEYKDQTVEVFGDLTQTRKIGDTAFLELTSAAPYGVVLAGLSADEEARAARLQLGDEVHVICMGVGMIKGAVTVGDCHIKESPRELTDPTSSPPQHDSASEMGRAVTASSGDQVSGMPSQLEADSQPRPNAAILNDGTSVSKSDPVLIYSAAYQLPEKARNAGIGGNVLVSLVVDANGLPSDVHAGRIMYVYKDGHASSGPVSSGDALGFAETAVEAVKQDKFRPALQDGNPVPMAIQLEVDFKAF